MKFCIDCGKRARIETIVGYMCVHCYKKNFSDTTIKERTRLQKINYKGKYYATTNY